MPIDLHIHTNFSDGTDSPKEIVEKAEIIGLETIAITDHETIEGFSSLKTSNIDIICGVEVSASWQELKVNNQESGIHILFYFVEAKTELNKLLKKIRRQKHIRNLEIIDKLKSLNIDIDISDIEKNKNQVLGRPHLAELMMKKGYVETINEAFNNFLGNGKPAYVDLYQVTVDKLLKVARDSKAVPVLAHPHTLNPTKNMLTNRKWINKELATKIYELKKMGLQGIETYYSSYDLPTRKMLAQIAEEANLLQTGGSDYHGDIKPGLNLGTGWENKPLNVPNEMGIRLKEKYESIK